MTNHNDIGVVLRHLQWGNTDFPDYLTALIVDSGLHTVPVPRHRTPKTDDPSDIDTRIGAAVQRMHTRAGITQEMFAAAAGIGYRTFQRLLSGEVPWRVAYLVGAAWALGVDPAAVLVEAGLSDLTADALSAVAVDRTLSPNARSAVAEVIRTFRDSEASTEEHRRLRESGFEFDRPPHQ